MRATVLRPQESREFLTPERCWILEVWNDPVDSTVSIARARVEPGVTTQLHRLANVAERYLVVEGSGVVNVGGASRRSVGKGDVVVIPAGAPQQISNAAPSDLVFYCICTPRFSPDCYESLE